jgi:steroid delta-isomerase-like uncharacterized protein
MALFKRRDAAWNRHDAAALAADHAEDAVGESPLQGRLVGRARIHAVYDEWFTAFPDLKWRSDDLVVDGNRAVQFFTMAGTHTTALGGIPATGRKFTSQARSSPLSMTTSKSRTTAVSTM